MVEHIDFTKALKRAKKRELESCFSGLRKALEAGDSVQAEKMRSVLSELEEDDTRALFAKKRIEIREKLTELKDKRGILEAKLKDGQLSSKRFIEMTREIDEEIRMLNSEIV